MTSNDLSIQVLIDVGAQILDVSNLDVIFEWFQLWNNVQAGVYFNYDGTAMMVFPNGKPERLATSYFQI